MESDLSAIIIAWLMFFGIVVFSLCKLFFCFTIIFIVTTIFFMSCVLIAFIVHTIISIIVLSMTLCITIFLVVMTSIFLLFVLSFFLNTLLFMTMFLLIAMFILVCFKITFYILKMIEKKSLLMIFKLFTMIKGMKSFNKFTLLFLILLSNVLPRVFSLILVFRGKCFDFIGNKFVLIEGKKFTFYFITIIFIFTIPIAIKSINDIYPCKTIKQKELFEFVIAFYDVILDITYFSALDEKNPYYLHCLFLPIIFSIMLFGLFGKNNHKIKMNRLKKETDYKSIVFIFSLFTKFLVDKFFFASELDMSYLKIVLAVFVLVSIKKSQKKLFEKNKKTPKFILFFIFFALEPIVSSIVNHLFFKKPIWFLQNSTTFIFITLTAIVLGLLCTIIKNIMIYLKND